LSSIRQPKVPDVGVEPLRPDALVDFLSGEGPAVLYVQPSPALPFNPLLASQLRRDLPALRCGALLLSAALEAGGGALVLLQHLCVAEGRGPRRLLPGYFLFQSGGRLLCYEGALPALGDLPALAAGGIVGWAAAQVLGRPKLFARALWATAQMGPAQRVSRRFVAALGEAPAGDTASPPPPPPPPPRSDLDRAYRILGVSPRAPLEEIHAAWRRLRAQHHPDLVVDDPAEYARRTRTSAELNWAWALIRNARRAGR